MSRRTFVAAVAAVCAGCRSGAEDDALPADRAPSSSDPGTVVAGRDTGAGGFGQVLDVGAVDEVAAAVDAGEGFHYVPEARAWVVRYPPEALADAEAEYGRHGDASMAAGFVALYQKCTHLGCRVPECASSGRFECPCHGSIFNGVGEWVAGPAPRGLDRFPVTVIDGRLHIDTASVVEGRDRGVSTLDQEPLGPSCIQP